MVIVCHNWPVVGHTDHRPVIIDHWSSYYGQCPMHYGHVLSVTMVLDDDGCRHDGPVNCDWSLNVANMMDLSNMTGALTLGVTLHPTPYHHNTNVKLMKWGEGWRMDTSGQGWKVIQLTTANNTLPLSHTQEWTHQEMPHWPFMWHPGIYP